MQLFNNKRDIEVIGEMPTAKERAKFYKDYKRIAKRDPLCFYVYDCPFCNKTYHTKYTTTGIYHLSAHIRKHHRKKVLDHIRANYDTAPLYLEDFSRKLCSNYKAEANWKKLGK